MTYRTCRGRDLPYPYAASGKGRPYLDENDKRWVTIYTTAFNEATALDAELLRSREENSRLTHENEFMLRLVNGRDNDEAFMTTRDRFAIAAMQGDWAAPEETSTVSGQRLRTAAIQYYRMADAMLAVRSEKLEDEE